jgi:hypothetical protein
MFCKPIFNRTSFAPEMTAEEAGDHNISLFACPTRERARHFRNSFGIV